MGAKSALEYPMDMAVVPDLRRFAGLAEVASAFLGAIVAGLLLMAPLDLAWSDDGGPLELDMLVLNMPRAAAAGAIFAVVAAALAVALGRRAAWLMSLGSATILLADHLWNLNSSFTGTLITVNYIDSIFGGLLLGTLGVAVCGRRITSTAFLVGALGAILFGDLTSLPESGGEPTFTEWLSVGTPPVWLLLIAVVALAAGVSVQRPADDAETETADLPIAPILAALVLVMATALSTEWFVRGPGTVPNIVLAAAVTLVAALLAALLLPGRDGRYVLLAVAVTNSGSAIFTVPRPDWSALMQIGGVLLGFYLGRRGFSPWPAFAGTGLLALFAALTADHAHSDAVIPIVGITALGLLMGYAFAGPAPVAPTSMVVALSALVVPCLVIALRGSSFGRIAYSPRWYRDPTGAVSATPGWTALAISLGCAAGLLLLYRLRPAGIQSAKRAFTHSSASS
ncbi:hypothetical protein [Nocardia sp. NPDC057668]|uniref:hypothetical protein n=1 Tax=Nocardia sp. NPDC057668 TaxID=3346202 RepID=UPI00366ACE52